MPVKFIPVVFPFTRIVRDDGVNVYRFADGVTVYVNPVATPVKL